MVVINAQYPIATRAKDFLVNETRLKEIVNSVGCSQRQCFPCRTLYNFPRRLFGNNVCLTRIGISAIQTWHLTNPRAKANSAGGKMFWPIYIYLIMSVTIAGSATYHV